MHSNFISGYSIKNDIFFTQKTVTTTTTAAVSNKTKQQEPQQKTNENISFRVANSEYTPNQRGGESYYYNSGVRPNDLSNDPKDSMIIYRYKQGDNLEIK